MDFATLAGFAIALGALVVSVFMDGGSLGSLFTPSAFVLIVGGTIGATVVGYRTSDLKRLPKLVLAAFVAKSLEPRDLIERLVRMAEKARREGLLALQDDVPTLINPLLVRGVQMIVDGTDPDIVRLTLETQVNLAEHRHLNAAGVLDAAGGYAPTIGIIGTVMGLVQVLGNLGEPDKLAHSIAVAFLATFFGILTANVLWLPLASKVKQNIHYETLISRMCIAGVVGLQTGEAPRALKEKLEVYISEAIVPRSNRRGGDDE
jgi:chemotaxis protein MotA